MKEKKRISVKQRRQIEKEDAEALLEDIELEEEEEAEEVTEEE